jgi:apolipoprotein N-acyltransferase
LVGAVTEGKGGYFNSALLIDRTRLAGRYDKLHLVPFGEYIPLKRLLPFLETVVPIGDIRPGQDHTVFEISNARMRNKFSVLICFEDLFPELSREFVKRGADFLVNITNDAWYKKTSAPYQHLAASVFRAVENRVFLARAANTGVSAFIAPDGKVISAVKDETGAKIFITGYRAQEIRPEKNALTFYTRYGEVFILLLLIFVVHSMLRPK